MQQYTEVHLIVLPALEEYSLWKLWKNVTEFANCVFYVAQQSVAVVRASLLLMFVFIIVALSNTCSPWKTQFISWVVVFCLALLYCPHADVFPWETGVTFPQAKSVAAEWTQSACQLIT